MMLQNKTVIITAGNRGGGLALAKKFVANGAKIIMIADKSNCTPTDDAEFAENAKLIAIDLSDVEQINFAIKNIALDFETIDILVNNYSIFNFQNVMKTTPVVYDNVMRNIFVTFFFSKACAPYLKQSSNPHIINIAPPLNMEVAKEACEHHLLFSLSKYGMSFCTLGMAEEFKQFGIAVNSLWQQRPIATKTLADNFDDEIVQGSNRPEIYAQAAYIISLKPSNEFTGNFCIDEEILIDAGIEPSQYAVNPNATPVTDIFLPGVDYNALKIPNK